MNTPITAAPTHPPELADDPMFWAPSRAFLKLAIAFTLAGCVTFEAALLAFAPEQTGRAVGAVVLMAIAVAAWALVSRGRMRAAALTLGVGEWLVVTGFLSFYGGVHGAAVILYPTIILMAGWMFSMRVAIAVASVTSAVTLLFVLGETSGALPAAPATSPTMRWVVQSFVFFLSAMLVPYVVRAYRDRLEEVRALGRDLARRTEELQASEADLHRAQAVARIGSWVYDLRADRISLSAETCRIFGLPMGTQGSHDDYLSRTHPEDRGPLDIAWRFALEHKAPFDREHRILLGNKVRWVRQIAQFESDPDGRVVRAVGTTQDITERREAENALSLTRIGVESTSDAMFWIKPDSTFVDVNPAACRTLGYTREELLKLRVADIDLQFGAYDWDAHFTELREKRSLRFESEHVAKDGRKFPVDIACNYVRIGDEERSCAVVRDISERRRQESEGLATRNQLAATLDAVPDLLFEVDLEGRYLDYRSPDPGLLAAPPEQLMGKTVMDVLPYAAANTCMAALREAHETGHSHGRQISLPLARGQLWFELSIAKKAPEPGQPPRFVVISRDITERKRTEDALRQREAELQGILGATADGILAVDMDGRVLHTSRRFAQLWRIPDAILESKEDQALLNHVLRQLVDPDAFLARVQALYASDAEENDTILFRDGRIFERFTSPLVLHGELRGRVWSFRDVTERKRAEDGLRASEEKFAKAFRSSPSFMAISSIPDGRFLDVNEAYERTTGYSREEIIGRTSLEFGLWADPADRSLITKRVQQQGRAENVEVRLRRKSGEVMLCEMSVERIEIDGVSCALSVSRDITGQSEMEKRLRQTQKMEAIGLLAGGIAHDFNNVLAAIRGGVQVAKSALPQEHAARVGLDQVEKSAGRALELVRQILTFSRGQDNERTAQDLAAAVQGAVQVMRAALPASIDIRTAFGPALPPVMTNSIAVHQVVMNLGLNAAHAMGDAGRLDIEVGVVDVDPALAGRMPGLRAGSCVCLTVRDTGCGMDEATLSRIFEPFFSTKEQRQGTGLGLSVVHGIVKEHGGGILVRSEPGKGAEFQVYFPALAEAANAPVHDVKPAVATAGQGERLLFVDDEADLVFLSKLLLERMGYAVETAGSSEEALARFAKDPGRFDALITDLSMPGMSGLELARKVLELRPGFPIIVMSGHIREVDAQRARALGIGELHWKPNTVEDLAETLRKRLGKTDA